MSSIKVRFGKLTLLRPFSILHPPPQAMLPSPAIFPPTPLARRQSLAVGSHFPTWMEITDKHNHWATLSPRVKCPDTQLSSREPFMEPVHKPETINCLRWQGSAHTHKKMVLVWLALPAGPSCFYWGLCSRSGHETWKDSSAAVVCSLCWGKGASQT